MHRLEQTRSTFLADSLKTIAAAPDRSDCISGICCLETSCQIVALKIRAKWPCSLKKYTEATFKSLCIFRRWSSQRWLAPQYASPDQSPVYFEPKSFCSQLTEEVDQLGIMVPFSLGYFFRAVGLSCFERFEIQW